MDSKEIQKIDPKEVRRQATREARNEVRAEINKMWMIVGAILGFVAIGAFIVFGFFLLQNGLRQRQERNLQPTVRAQVDQMLGEATKTARGFLSAASVEDKAKFVADSERVLPLMRTYYQTHKLESGVLVELDLANPHFAKDRTFLLCQANFQKPPAKTWVFERAPDGRLLLQWEVLTYYSDLPWEEFLRERPTSAKKMRVLLGEADYYNFAFSDKAVWESCQLTIPGDAPSIYGYLRRDSEFYSRLDQVRKMADTSQLPVIAELKFVEGGQVDQASIERILAFSWVDGVDM